MTTTPLRFCDVVDAVDQLSIDEQVELVGIVKSRLAEKRHEQLVEDIRRARNEYDAGLCKTGTAEELLREINA